MFYFTCNHGLRRKGDCRTQWNSPEDGEEEHDKHVGKMEMKPEKADDNITRRHATYGVERVLDVGRRKQGKNKLDGVLRITEAEFDHVHEPAKSNTTYTMQQPSGASIPIYRWRQFFGRILLKV